MCHKLWGDRRAGVELENFPRWNVRSFLRPAGDQVHIGCQPVEWCAYNCIAKSFLKNENVFTFVMEQSKKSRGGLDLRLIHLHNASFFLSNAEDAKLPFMAGDSRIRTSFFLPHSVHSTCTIFGKQVLSANCDLHDLVNRWKAMELVEPGLLWWVTEIHIEKGNAHYQAVRVLQKYLNTVSIFSNDRNEKKGLWKRENKGCLETAPEKRNAFFHPVANSLSASMVS